MHNVHKDLKDWYRKDDDDDDDSDDIIFLKMLQFLGLIWILWSRLVLNWQVGVVLDESVLVLLLTFDLYQKWDWWMDRLFEKK